MGDIEYLSKKAFDGKLIEVSGDIDVVTNTISHTVNVGKKFYFASAGLRITSDTSATSASSTYTIATNKVTAELKIDTTTKDKIRLGDQHRNFRSSGTAIVTTGGNGGQYSAPFDVAGLTAIAGEVITIENTSDSGSAFAYLKGFEEDTTTDPTILASSITVEAEISGQTTDIAFVEAKVLAGDYFQVSGDIDAITNEIVFVVPNTKTAFLLEAKITMKTNPLAVGGGPSSSSVNDQITAELKIDNVTKSKAHIGGSAFGKGNPTNNSGASGSGMGFSSESHFNIIGLSLVGDGVKEISIENVLDDGSGFAEMSGYLINT